MESVRRHYQVELRRSGKDQYRGCCPIHRGDGHDAFHVNLARNIFHCFACGADANWCWTRLGNADADEDHRSHRLALGFSTGTDARI